MRRIRRHRGIERGGQNWGGRLGAFLADASYFSAQGFSVNGSFGLRVHVTQLTSARGLRGSPPGEPLRGLVTCLDVPGSATVVALVCQCRSRMVGSTDLSFVTRGTQVGALGYRSVGRA
jgi:hypothetical protein